MLRSAQTPLSSEIADSQKVLALQRVYVIDAHERFVVIIRYSAHSTKWQIC